MVNYFQEKHMVKKKIMVNSKHVLAVSFELDYFCKSLSFKIDMFASCEQVKGNILMRRNQRIFQMVECNLKTNFSDKTWFVKRDLQLAAITVSSGY